MPPRAKTRTPGDTEDNYLSRREEIRAGATRVFAARGFATATMRDLADEIGILAGSLYHYFPSKDEILVEGLRAFYADTVRDLRAIVERGDDPSRTLADMIALAIRYLVERRDEATIILNDFDYLRASDSFAFIVASAAEVESLWVGVIERGVREGQFRSSIQPTLTYRAAMGAIFSAARWYDPSGAMDAERFVAQQTTTFLGGLHAPDA